MFNNFINNAKGLTRNPLGIIALFVSLIYGFACLVLSTSISNLNRNIERLPLIWFIIIFPLIILIAFIYLVIYHHEKLYAPGDFRGDESFIQTLEESKRKLKIKEEVETLESAPKSEDLHHSKESTKENDINEKTDSNVTTDEEQPSQQELIKIYTNSEKWAAKDLSLKYKVSFQTNVKLNTQGSSFELDAYATDGNKTYVAEIKYWKSNKSDKKLKLSIQEFLARHRRLMYSLNRDNMELKILIVLVYDKLEKVNQDNLKSFVSELNYENVYLEFFDYNELKRVYE